MATLTVRRNSRLEIRKWVEWLLEDYANAQPVEIGLDGEMVGVGINLKRDLESYRTAKIDARALSGWCGSAIEWAADKEAQYPQAAKHRQQVAHKSHLTKHPVLTAIVSGYDELIESMLADPEAIAEHRVRWAELKSAAADAG